MNKIKTILKLASCLLTAVLLFILGGCDDKPFEWDLPLALSQHNLSLSSDAGVNHILVYCTGDWTVGFDREIDWGSLDRRSGSGNGEVVFSFGDNYGISRKVTIKFTSGNLRDSVVISQSGTLSSATMSFPDSSITVADTAATITVSFSTNLLFAGCDFNSRVAYYDEDGNDWEGDSWISNTIVSADYVSFDVARNGQDLYRKADLTVYIEDAVGREYSAMLAITQIPVGMAY